MKHIKYLIAGIYFGIVLIKSEVISWFRIQEMFRFQGFHMYGVLGLAVITGVVWMLIIKKRKARANSEEETYKRAPYHHGLVLGGLMFGLGWAFTGACPGPIYALFGSGYWIFGIVFLSALAGVWFYGLWRSKLPH